MLAIDTNMVEGFGGMVYGSTLETHLILSAQVVQLRFILDGSVALFLVVLAKVMFIRISTP